MLRSLGCSIAVLSLALCLCACSSAPHKQEPANNTQFTATDSAAIKAVVESKKVTRDIDVAHESFIRAQEMELRGEKQLAEVFWQRAYEADPRNRYLAFNVAERLFVHGNDSAALALANEAAKFKGKVTSKQYELLAKLYVRKSVADSARKYFKLALDSAHGQDMTLLYDYSLFLEAVQDTKELVRVYDILLPQVNYIQSLFARQVNLLLEQNKDSAVVELFGKAHYATGDKSLLAKMVQGLSMQKRVAEVRAIADTITGTTEDDEAIINVALLTYGEQEQQAALKFLKKKVYDDGMSVSPVIMYYLGSYEYSSGEKDSAWVHLEKVYTKLGKNPAYAAQACRALSGIAFSNDKKKEAVRYAVLTDSLQPGGDKEFLAMAYGYAENYQKAYVLLDSMLGVWSHWRPMDGIADSTTLELIKLKADRAHRRLQNTYARVLVTEARGIEDDGKADTLKLSYAVELRTKAELFWESMLMADSTDMFVRFTMAMNLERLGRYDDSFRMFEKLLARYGQLQLDWPEVMNYYGYSLIDLNRTPEEVEKGYKLVLKALELDKDVVSDAFLDSKAWGLYRKGQYEEALATMLLIKSKNVTKDYVYWEHLGAIQAALGKKAEATKSYKNLLKLRPRHKAAREFLGKNKK